MQFHVFHLQVRLRKVILLFLISIHLQKFHPDKIMEAGNVNPCVLTLIQISAGCFVTSTFGGNLSFDRTEAFLEHLSAKGARFLHLSSQDELLNFDPKASLWPAWCHIIALLSLLSLTPLVAIIQLCNCLQAFSVSCREVEVNAPSRGCICQVYHMCYANWITSVVPPQRPPSKCMR